MSVRLALNILLVVGIVATVAGGGALFLMDAGHESEVVISLDEPGAMPAPVSHTALAPSAIKVYISGEARYPGVYVLPADARADDALQAAGGPTSRAALDLVNLAKRVSDEEQLHIPSQSVGGSVQTSAQGGPPAPTGLVSPAASGKLNINTATVEEFTSLPNIGPSRAAAIVAYREREGPFSSIDDLKKVSGIGEKITDSIRDLVEAR